MRRRRPPRHPRLHPQQRKTTQQPYYGILNDDNVYVRSGPSDERYYATQKLNKGAKVTVVETLTVQKDEWLKIIPPDGSFSYVVKSRVEKRHDGTVGRVTTSNLNVRAGSTLNNYKTTVQSSLEEGDDVKILGEDTEYFKIAPPTGAYLYVKKTFVDPAPVVANSQQLQQPVIATGPEPRMNYPIASNPVPLTVARTDAGAPPVATPTGAVVRSRSDGTPGTDSCCNSASCTGVIRFAGRDGRSLNPARDSRGRPQHPARGSISR